MMTSRKKIFFLYLITLVIVLVSVLHLTLRPRIFSREEFTTTHRRMTENNWIMKSTGNNGTKPYDCSRPEGEASIESDSTFVTCEYTKPSSLSCRQNVFQPVVKINLYVYSAFYTKNEKDENAILIIAFDSKQRLDFFCVIDYPGGKTLSVRGKLEAIQIMSREKLFKYIPTFVWCLEPLQVKPISVSITYRYCGEVSNMLIVEDRTKQADPGNDTIAICAKHMFNYTSPYAFIEWMEMQRIMGVTKVILYDYELVSPPVEKLLNYYTKVGFLLIQPWKPLWRSARRHYLGEIHTYGQYASINDCLYRFGDQFKYLLFFDFDEHVIPSSFGFMKLFQEIFSDQKVAGRRFKPTYYCVPTFLAQSILKKAFTQTFTNRTQISRDARYKVAIRPSGVRMMAVHHLAKIRPGYKAQQDVPSNIATLHHYRFYPGEQSRQCLITDESALQYGDILQKRMKHVLQDADID